MRVGTGCPESASRRVVAPGSRPQPSSSLMMFARGWVAVDESEGVSGVLNDKQEGGIRAVPAFEISHIASYLPLEGLKREESIDCLRGAAYYLVMMVTAMIMSNYS
jgi:hypothetical protein